MRLLAPMILVGRTALSVETRTKLAAPVSIAARATFNVPRTLLATPSHGLCSTIGTCL